MSVVVRLISSETGLPEGTVREIIKTAPVRYKTFYIVKKNGGYRKISQPARELKVIQRAFMKTVLAELPVHPSATAYRIGSTLLANVAPHAQSGPILKMDLKDFFPSIRRIDWIRYCQKNQLFQNEEDIELSSLLLFHKTKNSALLRLAIGAPSSPMLSNIIMFDFDNIIHNAVLLDKVKYTRYADDLTFSAPRTGHLVNVVKIVAKTIRNLKNPSLNINMEKTKIATTKYKRAVTGLIISNDGQITIGRRKKREIFSAIHYAINSRLSSESLSSLSGYLAFVHSVEPSFIEVLKRKYGADSVISIIRYDPNRQESVDWILQ